MPGMSTPYGRFNQIGNMFYSFNVGLMHVIAFSTESSIDTPWYVAKLIMTFNPDARH